VVKLTDQLRAMMANVNARFTHHGNGMRVYAMGLDASRIKFNIRQVQRIGPTVRHLTATGVSRAQE
jgi:outer membrane PBP1 activator LpoA protein